MKTGIFSKIDLIFSSFVNCTIWLILPGEYSRFVDGSINFIINRSFPPWIHIEIIESTLNSQNYFEIYLNK